MEGGFFLWRMEFFKVGKCDFTFIRAMRVATVKFLIKNQHFFFNFWHLGLPSQLWIFHNDICPLVVFQEVDLFWTSWSWWASPIYAYPIFQSTWIYGFHDEGLGWGLWWSGWGLAKAMKSSPLLGPFCGSEFCGFSLLKI